MLAPGISTEMQAGFDFNAMTTSLPAMTKWHNANLRGPLFASASAGTEVAQVVSQKHRKWSFEFMLHLRRFDQC